VIDQMHGVSRSEEGAEAGDGYGDGVAAPVAIAAKIAQKGHQDTGGVREKEIDGVEAAGTLERGRRAWAGSWPRSSKTNAEGTSQAGDRLRDGRGLRPTEVVVDCGNEEDKSRQEEQCEKDEGQGR
jgi:hypothetical protein